MKNMKKIFSVLLSVMMLGLLAAGCGSDKGGDIYFDDEPRNYKSVESSGIDVYLFTRY